MLARRYAAAALGVYDFGNVGGGVGLATPPFSPFIMSLATTGSNGKRARPHAQKNARGDRGKPVLKTVGGRDGNAYGEKLARVDERTCRRR